jgi:hypothetical protein
MQLTKALRRLMELQDRDGDFDYLGFLGVFASVERWARDADAERMAAFLDAGPEDYLGFPLGEETEDRRLSSVLELVRRHGQEVYADPAAHAPLN